MGMIHQRSNRRTIQQYLQITVGSLRSLTTEVDTSPSRCVDRNTRNTGQHIRNRSVTLILNFFLRDDDDFFGFPKPFDFDVVRANVRCLQFNSIVVFIVMGGVLASCAYAAMAVRKTVEKTANLNTVPVEKDGVISFEFILIL